ncbi:VOC family protein [Bdellovibrio sp. HCB337]|uniref:VOC family protein n=1 Tax=Bdellovibrio sp. HCB337 TaxID=3394358 RepID=UPI0039A6419E
MNKSDFYSQAESFLVHLFEQLKAHKVDLKPHWSIDHLCFRVQSAEAYQQYKQEFEKFGSMLIESEVNGRMIATYKLQEPVRFRGYNIDVVELPAPKPGKNTPEGFEHVEVVVDESFQSLKERFKHCQMDDGGLKKLFNQELEIEMQGCALKFHPLSLESVIAIEKNQNVYRALTGSKVLEILKPYHPVVAGTFPLEVHTDQSDLDILVTASDLGELSKVLQKNFSTFELFAISQKPISGKETLLARFYYKNVPFEIFAQNTESVQQMAYLHFQVEERLLRLGGGKFRQQVQELRKQGLKTEPAFAKALNIPGDPYEALLRLHSLKEGDLEKLLI